jgi:hypothetical protein
LHSAPRHASAGFGSQLDVIRSSEFYQVLVDTATRFYLLYQQHSTRELLMDDLVQPPGSSGAVTTVNLVSLLGPSTAMLSLDQRTERTPLQVASAASYASIRERLDSLPQGVR